MTSLKRSEPVAVVDLDDNRPEWATSSDRVPVFVTRRRAYPEGADVPEGADPDEIVETTYDMPALPNPAIALRFLKRARTEGELATAWMIETAIGEAGYDALTDMLEEIAMKGGDATATLQRVAQKIQTVLMGGLDAGPKA
jgi:hypothetical protein